MSVVKIIFYWVGGILFGVSFGGSLLLANSDTSCKKTKRIYRWIFYIGLTLLAIALILSYMQGQAF